MFGFGKRNKPVQPESPTNSTGQGGAGAPGGQGGGGAAPEAKRFPWTGDSSDIACNLACGSLTGSLPGWVTLKGRIHAETYVASAGGIAGYFAQLTLRAEKPGIQLHVITTKSGEQYYLGDPLNEMLLAKTERDAESRVWPRAGSAALHAGLAQTRIPDLNAMFQHVVGSLGGPEEGLPSTGPNHRPQLPMRELLKIFAPRVTEILWRH
jgi:hypothetical protein